MTEASAIIREVFGQHDGRFVVWRAEQRDGKPTKVPYQPDGRRKAKSNQPRTWGSFAEAIVTLRSGRATGAGFMLGDLGDGRFVVGKDWDLCRSPETGEIAPWAAEQIARWPSYVEVSPSGTGLKGYGYFLGVPPDGRKEITVDAPLPAGAEGSGHDKPEIGLYPGFDPRRGPGESKGRYFALTGLHHPDSPSELRDVTAEFLNTQAELEAATGGPSKRKSRPSAQPAPQPPPSGEVDQILATLQENDPEFAAAWESGAKIGPGEDDSGSGRDFSLAVWLSRAGQPDNVIAGILCRYPHGQIGSGKLRGQSANRRLGRILAQIREGNVDDARPVIRLAGGFLHSEVERAERELGRTGAIYQRGAMLVRVANIADPMSGAVRRAAGSTVILPLDRPTIRSTLTEAIRFERFDKRSEEYVPVNSPAEHAEVLLASAGRWPNIPPLLGIVEAPTLRPDGSVLDRPGYDAASGLYFADGGAAFPSVPLNPSRDDALAALDALSWPLAEIPFKADADRSVALSCSLTALTRRSLRAAPGFAITAPKMASGKTLVATLVSYIASGRAPAMMSQADDAESERKRLFAVLLEGASVAVIDNVERTFTSDALCSILTEPVFKDRVLGVSRTASAPTCTTWAVTGNNLTIQGDLTTRMLLCRIDPEVERPEEREFAHDLHVEVPKRRAELATAALTIIRAFIAAGSPRPAVPTFGRFEQWQEWCRFPLIWLGLADPCETRAAVEGRDPIRERLAELAGAWFAIFGNDKITLAEAVKEALKDPPLVPTTESDQRARLRTAMVEIAGEGTGVNLRKLGWFVAKHEGRIEGGYRFTRGEERRAGALWRVQTDARGAGFAGIAGFQQPLTRECQSSISDSSYDTSRTTAGENPQNSQNPREPADAEFDL